MIDGRMPITGNEKGRKDERETKGKERTRMRNRMHG